VSWPPGASHLDAEGLELHVALRLPASRGRPSPRGSRRRAPGTAFAPSHRHPDRSHSSYTASQITVQDVVASSSALALF